MCVCVCLSLCTISTTHIIYIVKYVHFDLKNELKRMHTYTLYICIFYITQMWTMDFVRFSSIISMSSRWNAEQKVLHHQHTQHYQNNNNNNKTRISILRVYVSIINFQLLDDISRSCFYYNKWQIYFEMLLMWVWKYWFQQVAKKNLPCFNGIFKSRLSHKKTCYHQYINIVRSIAYLFSHSIYYIWLIFNCLI